LLLLWRLVAGCQRLHHLLCCTRSAQGWPHRPDLLQHGGLLLLELLLPLLRRQGGQGTRAQLTPAS
jgi:hypothetical protein